MQHLPHDAGTVCCHGNTKAIWTPDGPFWPLPPTSWSLLRSCVGEWLVPRSGASAWPAVDPWHCYFLTALSHIVYLSEPQVPHLQGKASNPILSQGCCKHDMRSHLQAGVGAGLNLEDDRDQSGWGLAQVLEVRISGFWTCTQSDIRAQTFHIPPHDRKALSLTPHDSSSSQGNMWHSPDCLYTFTWCLCCGIWAVVAWGGTTSNSTALHTLGSNFMLWEAGSQRREASSNS